MFGLVFPVPSDLPTHHGDMLIVKLRESARRVAHGLHDPGRAPEGAPGLASLAEAERAGALKRAASLRGRRPSHVPRLPGALAPSVAAAASDLARGHRHAGAVLVELHSDWDLEKVRGALERDPHVEHVSPVPVRHALAAPSGVAKPPPELPFPPTRHWHLDRTEWAAARRLDGFVDATEVRVAVLDSGVEASHPALRGCVAKYVRTYADLPDPPSADDVIGHGTHVSGVIAARPRRGRPLDPQGACRCRLTVWKVFDDSAPFDANFDIFTYYVDPVLYRRALSDLIDRGVDVVNLSLGGTGPPDPHEEQLIRTLLDRGVTVVAAMGNLRSIGSPTVYPAATPGVVAVGATGPYDTIAPFSSRGKHIALCAPGVSIWSTLPTYDGAFAFHAVHGSGKKVTQGAPIRRNTWYDAWPGTSAATPQVAAAAALLRANRPGIAGGDVRARLMSTADRVPGMKGARHSRDYGAGRLNYLRLLSE